MDAVFVGVDFTLMKTAFFVAGIPSTHAIIGLGKIRRQVMQTVHDFIKACGIYYLATVEGSRARVRPFGTINIFDGKLYIQTRKNKDVSKQIQENPNVELSCFDGKTWLRLSGELVRDDRIEAKKDMLEKYPSLQKMYSAEDENTEVLYFRDAAATFSSFTGEPRTVKF